MLGEVVDGGRLGRLVPVDERYELAAALEEVMRHPGEARARSKGARSAFVESLTLDRVTGEMVPLLTRATRADPSMRSPSEG